MNLTISQSRLRELDFLRGVAIILVLFRHQHFFELGRTMGWIGVDLFFVLSGFLVSGLLFKEYKRNGFIDPLRFLIRRGFKIYPVYYSFFIIYLLYYYFFLGTKLSALYLISDLAFLQNYMSGWGYLYDASWSLAVEEHFYFGLTLVVWLAIKKGLQLNVSDQENRISLIEKSIFFAMVTCLVLRIISNYISPDQLARNFSMTHLRIDSLLAGVYIAYLFYFKGEYLREFYTKYKKVLLVIPFVVLLFTPFLDPVYSFFVKTFGFTLIYLSFGCILIIFVSAGTINKKLNSVLGRHLVDIISKIGFYSYSIYVIHSLIFEIVKSWKITNDALVFILSIAISIFAGKIVSDVFEAYFLRLRERYYPSKVS